MESEDQLSQPDIDSANQRPNAQESSTTRITEWKHPATFLLLSQGVSILGSSVVQYAMVWYITLTTLSGTMIALATVFAFLPALLLSPIAGVWADRYNRRVLIVASDAVTALATLVIMVAFISGNRSLPLMMAALAIRGTAGAIQRPASNALIPGFIPTDQLRRFNGMLGMVHSLSEIIGPALGGVALAIWPIHAVFAIDIVTAIIGISLFWFLVKVPAYGVSTENLGSWSEELVSGIRYIKHHQFLPTLMGFIAASIFVLAAPMFLSNLHVGRTFGGETWRLSVVETCFGIGGIVGGAAVSAWVGFRREMTTTSVAAALMGATIICLGIAPNFWAFLVAMSLLGFIFPYLNTPLVSLVQRTCDPSHLGKVMSVFMMINSALFPLGMVLFGPLGDHIPVWLIMIIGGGVQVAISAAMLTNPKLRAIPVANPAQAPAENPAS